MPRNPGSLLCPIPCAKPTSGAGGKAKPPPWSTFLEIMTMVALGLVVAITIEARNPRLDRNFVMLVVGVPLAAIFVLSHHWIEVRSGRSLGMAILRLSFRRLDGKPLDWDTVLDLRYGPARAGAFVLADEDWERLEKAGIRPMTPPKYEQPT